MKKALPTTTKIATKAGMASAEINLSICWVVLKLVLPKRVKNTLKLAFTRMLLSVSLCQLNQIATGLFHQSRS